jgi:hypothetical protein
MSFNLEPRQRNEINEGIFECKKQRAESSEEGKKGSRDVMGFQSPAVPAGDPPRFFSLGFFTAFCFPYCVSFSFVFCSCSKKQKWILIQAEMNSFKIRILGNIERFDSMWG